MIMNLMARIFGSSTHEGRPDGIQEVNGRAEDTPSIESLVDPFEALGTELGRARRYEHALSIVVVSPQALSEDGREADGGSPGDIADRLGIRPRRALSYLTAAGLREILRTSDIVCYDATDGRFVVGLAESDSLVGQRAMARVQRLFRSRLGIELVIGVAQFPTDALTLEDLVTIARERAVEAETGSGAVDGQAGDPDIPWNPTPQEASPRAEARAIGHAPRQPRSARRGPAVSADKRAVGGGE
jgi:hypothetical protein